MKKKIIGLAIAVMAMVAGGCGVTGTGSEIDSSLQQAEVGSGSVRIKVDLYNQGASTTLATSQRAGGLMRVQDIMKGMTKKLVVYLYEVDNIGNFVQGGLVYSSTAKVADGVANIVVPNVSAGRSYYLSAYGSDENGLHDLFVGWQNSVPVLADVTADIDVRMEMVAIYWIDNLVLSNISGNYQDGGYYTGTVEGFTAFGPYSYSAPCIFAGQGKMSCSVGVLTEETSLLDFSITDTDGVEHVYRFRIGIRDALDDGKIEVDLASGNLSLEVSFILDVDQIYFDGLSGEINYAWYASYGGLPIGIAVGDTLEFTYDDGTTKVVATAIVTAYADGSGDYCKIVWSQLPQSWWSKNYYTVKVITPIVPVL